MTWYLDPETGDVYSPDGTVRGNAGDAPYQIPQDAQDVAYLIVQEVGIGNLTDQQLIWLFEVAGGDVKFGTPDTASV